MIFPCCLQAQASDPTATETKPCLTETTVEASDTDSDPTNEKKTEQSCETEANEVSEENRQKLISRISDNTLDFSTVERLLLGQSYLFYGRVDVDWGAFWGEPLSDEDGFSLRRLQVGIAGIATFFDNLGYKVELDFSDGNNNFSDVYIQYDNPKFGSTRLGNQRVSQSFSAYTSSLSQLFMEPPLPVTAFSLARRIAISQSYYGEKWGVNGMYFGSDVNNSAGKSGGAIRAFVNPVRSDGGVAHIGFSWVTEKMKDNTRLRSLPESKITDIYLLDTGIFYDVKDRQKLGLEFAGAVAATSSRLELFRTRWDRTDGKTNYFNGAYFELGRFLTGQSFKYTHGQFVRPTIESGSHAWEAGLRVSWADLDSRDVQGGEQVNFGVAVNYYRQQNLRVMMNLLRFNAKSVAGNDKGWILQARVQYNR